MIESTQQVAPAPQQGGNPESGHGSADATTPQRSDGAQRAQREYLERFQQLTNRERMLARKEQQLKEADRDLATFRKLRESRNPEDVLKAFDLDYNQVTQHYLQGGHNPVNEVTQRLSQLEERTRAAEREALEREQNAVRHRAVNEIKGFIEASESFPAIKALDAHENVLALCDQYHEAYGKALTYEEAARMVEDDLMEYFGSKFKPLREADWFRKALGLEGDPNQYQSESQDRVHVEEPRIEPPRSLSGLSSPAATPPRPGGRVSDEQLRKEAMEEIAKVFQRRQGQPMF